MQGLAQGFLREWLPRRPECDFERADNSPRREGSRLSEIPCCSCSCFVPSPRQRGNSPERGAGRDSVVFGRLLISE